MIGQEQSHEQSNVQFGVVHFFRLAVWFVPQKVGGRYSIRLNLKEMGPLQFCLPVFLGIHRNPKQKECFNSRKGFFRWSHLSTFIHLDKHLDRA